MAEIVNKLETILVLSPTSPDASKYLFWYDTNKKELLVSDGINWLPIVSYVRT